MDDGTIYRGPGGIAALMLGALIGLVICSVLAILTPHVGVIP